MPAIRSPVLTLRADNQQASAEIAVQNVRLEQERLTREQTQREQAALADRMRIENQQRDAVLQEEAGVDTIVPLDTNYPVKVGSAVVTVKVHDNDVTSFDVWINGHHEREVKKNKGVTGSRADETILYTIGNAKLYYVWEISGKLNHCRLRVRGS